jgi:hypothetical protein
MPLNPVSQARLSEMEAIFAQAAGQAAQRRTPPAARTPKKTAANGSARRTKAAAGDKG